MRRLLTTSAVLGLLVAVLAVAPVSARTRTDVMMTVATYFEQEPNAFTSSIEGCTEGLTYSGGNAAFPPRFGVFVGYKAFLCDGSEESGFLVRLNAKFSYSGAGSVGTWTIVDSWGDLAGMTGSGKLIGVPIEGENGITDNYFGTVTL
jgi:hypothetical protein